jgi:hypothetical protein
MATASDCKENVNTQVEVFTPRFGYRNIIYITPLINYNNRILNKPKASVSNSKIRTLNLGCI